MLCCFVLGYIRFGWIRGIWVGFSKFHSRVVLAHSTVSQEFAGLALSIGRQETLVSAVIR